MEELAGFIPLIIIAVVSAIAKSSKNKQKAQQTHFPPASAGPAEQLSMASMLPPRPEGSDRPAQPTVHTHLELDCDTHDAPANGSLGAVRTEGTDPCHDELQPHRTAVPAAAEARPGLTLEWSGDAMVKAFVMQEILTRPGDRRR